MDYHSALERKAILTHATTRMNFEDTMLGEIRSGGSAGKEYTCNAGDLGSILGLGRSPGKWNGYPLQYLAWRIPWTTVHRVTKTWTQLSDFHFTSKVKYCIIPLGRATSGSHIHREKNRIVVATRWRQKGDGIACPLCSLETGFQFCKMKRVFEIGCRTVWMVLLLNVQLKWLRW